MHARTHAHTVLTTLFQQGLCVHYTGTHDGVFLLACLGVKLLQNNYWQTPKPRTELLGMYLPKAFRNTNCFYQRKNKKTARKTQALTALISNEDGRNVARRCNIHRLLLHPSKTFAEPSLASNMNTTCTKGERWSSITPLSKQIALVEELFQILSFCPENHRHLPLFIGEHCRTTD